MEKTFGIPYEAGYPILDKKRKKQICDLNGKKMLVIHQQVMANEIRKRF